MMPTAAAPDARDRPRCAQAPHLSLLARFRARNWCRASSTVIAPAVLSYPEHGLRFDPSKVLLDPYGRAVVVPEAYSRQLASQCGATIRPRP